MNTMFSAYIPNRMEKEHVKKDLNDRDVLEQIDSKGLTYLGFSGRLVSFSGVPLSSVHFLATRIPPAFTAHRQKLQYFHTADTRHKIVTSPGGEGG